MCDIQLLYENDVFILNVFSTIIKHKQIGKLTDLIVPKKFKNKIYEIVLKLLEENSSINPFENIPHHEMFMNDIDFILMAVKKNGMLLMHSSEYIKGIDIIVLAAVTQNGNALQFANKQLKARNNIVSAAVKSNVQALQCADKKLQIFYDYKVK